MPRDINFENDHTTSNLQRFEDRQTTFSIGDVNISTEANSSSTNLQRTNTFGDFFTFEDVAPSTSVNLISEISETVTNPNRREPKTWAKFGSLVKRFDVAIQKYMSDFPASIYSSVSVLNGQNIITSIYNPVTNTTKISLDTNYFKNEFDINYTGTIYSAQRNLVDNYSDYIFYVDGNEYNITNLTPTSRQTNDVLMLNVSGQVFQANTSQRVECYIKPKQQKFDKFYQSLDSFELYLLNPQTNFISLWNDVSETEGGAVVKYVLQFQFPKVDLFNIPNALYDNQLFTTFYTDCITYFDKADQSQSNLVLRKLAPQSLYNSVDSDEDSNDAMESLLLSYGRAFDEQQDKINGIKTFSSLSYDNIESIPDNFLKSFALQMGFDLNSSIFNSDDARYFLLNLTHIYKMKGRREAIEFLLRFFNIPSEIVNYNTYVYRLSKSLDLDLLQKYYDLLLFDGQYQPFNNNGLIDYTKIKDYYQSPTYFDKLKDLLPAHTGTTYTVTSTTTDIVEYFNQDFNLSETQVCDKLMLNYNFTVTRYQTMMSGNIEVDLTFTSTPNIAGLDFIVELSNLTEEPYLNPNPTINTTNGSVFTLIWENITPRLPEPQLHLNLQYYDVSGCVWDYIDSFTIGVELGSIYSENIILSPTNTDDFYLNVGDCFLASESIQTGDTVTDECGCDLPFADKYKSICVTPRIGCKCDTLPVQYELSVISLTTNMSGQTEMLVSLEFNLTGDVVSQLSLFVDQVESTNPYAIINPLVYNFSTTNLSTTFKLYYDYTVGRFDPAIINISYQSYSDNCTYKLTDYVVLEDTYINHTLIEPNETKGIYCQPCVKPIVYDLWGVCNGNVITFESQIFGGTPPYTFFGAKAGDEASSTIRYNYSGYAVDSNGCQSNVVLGSIRCSSGETVCDLMLDITYFCGQTEGRRDGTAILQVDTTGGTGTVVISGGNTGDIVPANEYINVYAVDERACSANELVFLDCTCPGVILDYSFEVLAVNTGATGKGVDVGFAYTVNTSDLYTTSSVNITTEPLYAGTIVPNPTIVYGTNFGSESIFVDFDPLTPTQVLLDVQFEILFDGCFYQYTKQVLLNSTLAYTYTETPTLTPIL